MKTCPVCKATVFDDMDVCYGCLYRFSVSSDATDQEKAGETKVEPSSVKPSQNDTQPKPEGERDTPKVAQEALENKQAGAENVKAICLPLFEQKTQPLDVPRVQKWTLKIELSIPKVEG